MIRKIKEIIAAWRAHRELLEKFEQLSDPTFLERATSGR